MASRIKNKLNDMFFFVPCSYSLSGCTHKENNRVRGKEIRTLVLSRSVKSGENLSFVSVYRFRVFNDKYTAFTVTGDFISEKKEENEMLVSPPPAVFVIKLPCVDAM